MIWLPTQEAVESSGPAAISLGGWDWFVLVWTLAVTTGVGLWYASRAGRDADQYFLSGRDLPWWALGTSIVATTFAADTPIAVSEKVLESGISWNWVWWSFLIGGTLTVFVFSRWWRRAEVFTEVELLAVRYDGVAASILRGFKAVYLGLLVNAIIIGFVTEAMSDIVATVFDIDPFYSLALLFALTAVYATASGLWGVVATDVLQFALALVGAIVLAVVSVSEAGGLTEVVASVRAVEAETGRDILSLIPSNFGDWFSVSVLVLVLVNWWAVYYPGAEPGGGGYVAQRMLAAKNENHARAGTLWYLVAHYVLRPWPWILVALAAVALTPQYVTGAELDGEVLAARRAYPSMFRLLPPGMLGVVVASFVAAFMSTITTQLNLASSFLVRDLYQPFLKPPGAEKGGRGDVLVGQFAVLLVTGVGIWTSVSMIRSAGQGWSLLMDFTAGTGLVLIARWLWWRVNAWSEISALLASAVAFTWCYGFGGTELLARSIGAMKDGVDGVMTPDLGNPMVDRMRLLVIVAFSTAVWIPVTLLTKPTGRDTLAVFFKRVVPGGFWRPIADDTGVEPQPLGRDLMMWAVSTIAIGGALLGIGTLLLHDTSAGIVTLLVSAVAGVVLGVMMRTEPPPPAAA